MHAQEPAYIQYGVEDGLPSSLVYCMLQDQRGFLWFGTDKGLARFDGFRFKVFSIKDGLPDSEVLNMFEDSKGRIWLSCFQKKPCYFYEGEFRTAENDSILAQAETKSGTYTFFEDDEGVIWVASNTTKFCTFSTIKTSCYETTSLLQTKTTPIILSFKEISDNLYAITKNKIYNITNLNKSFIADSTTNLTTENYVMPTITYSDSEIFYFFDYSLIKFYFKKNRIIKSITKFNLPSSNKIIWNIYNSSMWVCPKSKSGGAYKIVHPYDNSKKMQHYLKGNEVTNIHQPDKYSIWFTTSNNGVLAKHHNTSINFTSQSNINISSQNITSIITSDDEVLFGDNYGNIYTYDNSLNEIKNEIRGEHFNSVRQLSFMSQNLWVAVTNNYLVFKNKQKAELLDKYIIKNDATFNKFGALKNVVAKGSEIWIGTSSDLIYYQNFNTPAIQIIKETRITALGADSEQNVWAATVDGFLSEKDSFQTNWGAKFKPLAGRVLDIKATEDGKLWVATSENGLLRLEVNNGEVLGFEIINQKIVSPIESIKSLFAAHDGKLWVATSNGIYSLDENLNVKHYDTSDGLPSNDVNAVAVQQDTLWAATVAGLSKIQLNQPLESNDFRTYISGISYYVDNNNVSKDLIYRKENSIILPSSSSLVELQFSGLHFGSQGNITYEVVETKKLLPFQWLTWDNFKDLISSKLGNGVDTTYLKTHSKNYGVNVQSGCSEIIVTAITKNGVKSIHSDKLSLTILPAWHETLWVNLFLIGIALLIGWVYYRQTTAVRRLKQETNDLQLQAIKSQINPHFIGNSINAIQQFFYPPNPSKASLYISNFSNMLRRTMHLSDASFIQLHEEILFISDYLEMVKLRFENRFFYKIKSDSIMDSETPFPAMILQPIIENATIHGLAENGETLINIEFKQNKNYISCSIADNGIGISKSIETKKENQNKRISKGIELLKKKITIINKMHKIDLKIKFIDIANLTPHESGTIVTISYKIDNLSGFKTPQRNE